MELQTPLKVVIEFDLSRESDRELINVITQVKGAQAKGQVVSLSQVISQLKTEAAPTPNLVQNLEKAGKTLTAATNELQQKIGEERKLTTKERASIAAKAKWAKFRAEKAGLPAPAPAARKKKNKKKDMDLSKAEKHESNQFPIVDAHDEFHGFNGSSFSKTPQIPDGRDIIDGTFEDHIEEEDHEEVRTTAEYSRGMSEKSRDI